MSNRKKNIGNLLRLLYYMTSHINALNFERSLKLQTYHNAKQQLSKPPPRLVRSLQAQMLNAELKS